MGIFLWNKKESDDKGELVLVFDIGSASVGGALFRKRKSGIPQIVKTFREPIILEKNIDIDQFLLSTAKSLDIIVNKIYKTGVGAPSGIFCFLSSPWHVSETRVISLKKNTPFMFTTKLADDLIKKEISLFEDEHLVEYAHADNAVRSIELKNIKTMLNGYETPKPLDQKTKELEMTIFISISPEQVLKKIEETIMRHFHFEAIKFSSFVMASFAVVRDMYIHEDGFLLIDIGGEVTDISMIKKNALRGSISFPLGCNFIVRGIASALSSSPSEAKSLISLSKDGHAAESVVKKLEPALTKLKAEWLDKFQESLSNLSNDISIPATIYLTLDTEMAAFFSEIIKTQQFNQYNFT